MGNSMTAVGNDLSGTLFNPAALGLTKITQLNLGLNFSNFDTKTTFFNNINKSDKVKNSFSQIGIVAPLPTSRGSLVFAFSYNRIKDFNKKIEFDGFNSGSNSMVKTLAYANDDLAYDLGLSYKFMENNVYKYDDTKINGDLQQIGNISETGYFDKYTGAIAIEWGKNLFVGFTVNMFSGEYEQNRNYQEIDTKNVYPLGLLLDDEDDRTNDFRSFEMIDRIYQDVFGYSFTAGFLYKTRNGFNFAGSVKTPDFLEIKEQYKVRGYSSFADVDFETKWKEYNTEYDVKTPFEFTIGGSYSRNNLTISVNAQFINYRQMEFTKGFDSQDEKAKNDEIDKNFRTVTNFNLGLEYKVPKAPMKIRGGFIFKKSPYKDDDSKFDKKYLTAGIGYKLNRSLVLDVAYVYGWWENIGDNYGSNESRTFQDINKSNLVFNVIMRL